MKQKIIILYDLKGKSQVEKVQILRKLYGYRDNSNYDYNYKRTGVLNKTQFTREKKTVIKIENDADVAKVTELLKKLKVNFELGKI